MEKKEPLISIVLPVYNVEKYVEKCIRSILAQSYKRFELIIVNDSSTDNSLEICRKFNDNNVIILNNGSKNKGGGLSSARNLGMQYCCGEYITFIDSDDWIEYNYLEELVHGIIDEDVDMVQCGYKRKLNDRKTLYKKCFSEKIIDNNTQVLDEYFVENSIYTAVWGKLFRKDSIGNLLFKEGYNYEDVIFMADLLEKIDKVKLIDKTFYNYRLNKNSITQSSVSKERVHDILYAYEYAWHKFKNYQQNYAMYINYTLCGVCIELYYQLWLKDDPTLNYLKSEVTDKFMDNYNTLNMRKLKTKRLGKLKIIFFRYHKKMTLWILRVFKLMNIMG